MILVHSNNSVTAVSMLRELYTTSCLRHLQMDLHDKSIKMSFCTYMGASNLSYLNHIIITHYNDSYGCGKCLKQAFVSSSALHNHKKVCLGFDKKPAKGSDSKPSSSGGGNNSQGGSSMRAMPKKHASKAPSTDSQGSSAPTASQMTLCCSRHDSSHHSKSHKDLSGDKKKKKGHASPTRKGRDEDKDKTHKSHKHIGWC